MFCGNACANRNEVGSDCGATDECGHDSTMGLNADDSASDDDDDDDDEALSVFLLFTSSIIDSSICCIIGSIFLPPTRHCLPPLRPPINTLLAPRLFKSMITDEIIHNQESKSDKIANQCISKTR